MFLSTHTHTQGVKKRAKRWRRGSTGRRTGREYADVSWWTRRRQEARHVLANSIFRGTEHSQCFDAEETDQERLFTRTGNAYAYSGSQSCRTCHLVSCFLNSSPNLKDLRIIESRREASPVPLAAEYWEKQLNADCVLNHLSSFTFFIEWLFEGHPCGGLCRFMVMKERVLKCASSTVARSSSLSMQPNLKMPRSISNLWPRASLDLPLELSPLDRYPSY